MLAWRIVRLHGAAPTQGERFAKTSHRLRRLMIKSAAAGATSSPITQLIAAVRAVGGGGRWRCGRAAAGAQP